MNLPPLAIPQILRWADAFHRRRGTWPKAGSGPIPEAPGETWRGVQYALRSGIRGLPGGSSLARLLAARRGVRNRGNLPPLTKRQILVWADAHHARTGRWPTSQSGPIRDAPGETWLAIHHKYTAQRLTSEQRASIHLRGRNVLPRWNYTIDAHRPKDA